jgi:AraC-like DNA-binding protein
MGEVPPSGPPMSYEPPGSLPEPTVRPAWARRLIDALTVVGFDAASHIRRQGWDLTLLQEDQARVPWRDVVDLWAAAARSTGDPHLGLHAAESPPFRVESPFGYLIASSPTLREGFQLMIRYQGLHSDEHVLSIEERGDHVAVVVRLPELPPATSHQNEHVCAVLRRLSAWIVGPSFRLLGVRFRHAGPSTAGEHERIFGCPVQFNQPETAVLLAPEMLSKPSLFANPSVLAAVRPVADSLLAERRTRIWALRVKTALQAQLAAPCRIEAVAKQLGLSRRTLQRKLAAEYSTFEKVLDECRRDRALELVRRQEITLSAVASAIGFSNSQAFARAFQRWTGRSPAAHRATSTSPGGDQPR